MNSEKYPGKTVLFTEKQGQYLAFIDAYTRVHDIAPSQADIQKKFKVTAPTVHQMILALEKKNLLQRETGRARSLKVLVPYEDLPKLH